MKTLAESIKFKYTICSLAVITFILSLMGFVSTFSSLVGLSIAFAIITSIVGILLIISMFYYSNVKNCLYAILIIGIIVISAIVVALTLVYVYDLNILLPISFILYCFSFATVNAFLVLFMINNCPDDFNDGENMTKKYKIILSIVAISALVSSIFGFSFFFYNLVTISIVFSLISILVGAGIFIFLLMNAKRLINESNLICIFILSGIAFFILYFGLQTYLENNVLRFYCTFGIALSLVEGFSLIFHAWNAF